MILTAIGVLGILSYSPIFPYTEAQYIIASFIIFIATNVLEGIWKFEVPHTRCEFLGHDS